jgi:hypothetical protein
MSIGSVTSTPSAQIQALAVTNVVQNSAANQASDQSASSVVRAAAGVRVSGRTAQSLTSILQAVPSNLGYSKAEVKSFTAMMDAARKYLDDIKQWGAQEAAAAETTDPEKIAINANPTDEVRGQQQKVQAYDQDFIAKMQSSLDQVMSAFLDHKLVFKSFSIGGTGDVSIMAKSFKTTDDGKVTTDLSFSFFQTPLDENTQSKTNGQTQYGIMWSVNDLTLFNAAPKRVL